SVGVGVDTQALIDLLRGFCPTDDETKHIEESIRQLRSPTFAERKHAQLRLIQAGRTALPQLRTATQSSKADEAKLARQCAESIEQLGLLTVPDSAVRLLANRRAYESFEVLLQLLPFCNRDELTIEIWYALEQLALVDGRIHPALTKGLNDLMSERRA